MFSRTLQPSPPDTIREHVHQRPVSMYVFFFFAVCPLYAARSHAHERPTTHTGGHQCDRASPLPQPWDRILLAVCPRGEPSCMSRLQRCRETQCRRALKVQIQMPQSIALTLHEHTRKHSKLLTAYLHHAGDGEPSSCDEAPALPERGGAPHFPTAAGGMCIMKK